MLQAVQSRVKEPCGASQMNIISTDSRAKLSAFVAVPVLLFLIDWLSRLDLTKETEFLLLPPLAVIIYLIFSHPDAKNVNFRSVVLAPVIGAAVGELCYHYFGLTPWGIAIATIIVLLFQAGIGSDMPPALALAVLAMLLRAQGAGYTVGVALATLLVWFIFLVWRRFVWREMLAK
jgi:hypothetical protein